jgi:[ribosomal protein S5]-alanine N-acetyltransferase
VAEPGPRPPGLELPCVSVECYEWPVERPVIRTERLVLSLPQAEDAAEMLAYGLRNYPHHAPWSPPPPPDAFTLECYQRLVQRIQSEFESGRSVGFWLRLGHDPAGKFVGAAALTQITLGAFRACHLGYHVDHEYEGQGYMSEAVSAVIQHAFRDLRLHRIMANYMPTNRRSERVLERQGFVKEGYAKDYLFIGDRWEDHVMTALTNHDLAGSRELVCGGR